MIEIARDARCFVQRASLSVLPECTLQPPDLGTCLGLRASRKPNVRVSRSCFLSQTFHQVQSHSPHMTSDMSPKIAVRLAGSCDWIGFKDLQDVPDMWGVFQGTLMLTALC